MASSSRPQRASEILQLDFPKDLQVKLDHVKAMNFNIRAELPAFDKGLVYSTTGLLNTKHKHDMYYAFESGGAPGLAHYLYKYAQKRQTAPGNTEAKYFTDDRLSHNPVLPYLITTIHPDVVRALICGNLAYRYHKDTNFKRTIHRTITATTSPGIYFNQLYDCGTDLAAQTQTSSVSPASETEGKGFSYKDWRIISEDMDLYCNVKKPGSKDLAKAIDYVFVSHQPGEQIDHDRYPDQRRYFVSSRDGILQEFLKAVEDRILKKGRKLDKAAKSEQAEWSVYEIGYSVDSLNRIKDHHGNKATNWIWGLINAIAQHRFPDRFKIFSGQILYLCDDSHRNLGEALCSVLGSSYWDLMGCNPKRAGSIGSAPPTAQRGYRENIIALLSKSGIRHRNWERGLEHTLSIITMIKNLEKKLNDLPLIDVRSAGMERRSDILNLADEVLKRHRTVEYMKAEHLLTEELRDWLRRRDANRQAQMAQVAVADRDDEGEGILSDDGEMEE